MSLYRETYRIESARLRGWDYRARGWYFVTNCTRNRACILADIVKGKIQLSPTGQIADAELKCYISTTNTFIWMSTSSCRITYTRS